MILALAISAPETLAAATSFLVNCIRSPTPPPSAACFDAVVGQPHDFWVVALDQNWQIDANYRGTVHITTSDPTAYAPADYTFGAADAGTVQLSVTFHNATSADVPSIEYIEAQGGANLINDRGPVFLYPASQPQLSSVPLLDVGAAASLVGLLFCLTYRARFATVRRAP